MTSSSGILIMVLLTSALATLCSSSRIADVDFDHHVVIKNSLEHQQGLQVHCKDRNEDFGVWKIPYGVDYEFLIHQTLTADYYCGFVFDNVLHWFDIYLQRRDYTRCSSGKMDCLWSIKESGPCYNDNVCYPWNSNVLHTNSSPVVN